MEAGNRCFDPNVPEEINRKIVDVSSDINLAYTEHARRYLIGEGKRPEYTFVTGSPLPEVMAKHDRQINASQILEQLKLDPKQYILVSAHREENISNEENFHSLIETLNQVAEHFQLPIIVSTHPRTWKKINDLQVQFHSLIRPLKPFGFYDYNKLQREAYCVLSDSGSLAEESSILGFPAVSIRTSTERPEALDKGSFILGGLKSDGVLQAILQITNQRLQEESVSLPSDYQDINVSTKVVNLIQGYTEIVNLFLWRKTL